MFSVMHVVTDAITFSTFWADSADDKLMMFSLIFRETDFDISFKLSQYLREMPKSVS